MTFALAAIAAVILALLLDEPVPSLLMVLIGAVYVIARHRANIGRLLAGNEPRVGQSIRN